MLIKPRHYLFDLDSTLYSDSYGLEKNVSRRVNEFLASFFHMSMERSWELRRQRILEGGYGTTLEWLIAEHNFSGPVVEEYFAHIHPEGEEEALRPDPALRELLVSLDAPMAILTNSPTEHAVRILRKLEIEDLFPTIFDIRVNGLKGKPRADVFYSALKGIGAEAESCVFVDDARFYVEGYRAIGGWGVFYDEKNEHPEFPAPRILRLEELRQLSAR